MKLRSMSAVAVLAAGALTFAGAVVLGGGANAATSNGGYKIMPLGDSITYGFNSSGGGYRPTLWKDLVGAGATVDFVGSVSDNPPANGLGDGDHEGHSGWTTQQIYDNVTNWQKTYQPQTILLHIGTNDITNNNASAAATLLGSLVDRILANNPSVNLFVAEIIPLSYSSGDNVAKQFNSTIPSMVASRAAKGSKVYVVDMHSALTTSDLSDAVHPNNTGYAKMGDAWFNAMKQHPESYGKGGTTTTTTTTTGPTTTTTSPQNGVVSESTFEDGTVGSWTGRASEQLSVSTTAHSGSRALAVAGRSASWNGPALNVTSTLRPGSTYYLSAWARLASGETATTATLSVQRTSSGTTAYDHVVADVAVSADGWAQLTGSYTVPSDATAVTVYVELASDTAGLLLDDVVASTSPIVTSTTTTTTTTTTTGPTTTTTKPTTTKTTKSKSTKLVKKCKTGKNGKKTCKTVTKTVKAGAAQMLLPDFVTES